jgi:hypothetical protein
LIALTAVVTAAPIDAILYRKIAKSTPSLSSSTFNRYASNLYKTGSRYSRRIHRNSLGKVRNQSFTFKAGGRTHRVYPFREFMALRWGEKLEHLESKKYISGAGRYSWGYVTASIGQRNSNGYVDMRTAWGWTQAKTKQMYKRIRYRSCRRRWFRKRCKWKTKSVKRGLSTGEMNVLHTGMLRYAHQGALSKIPSRLSTEAPELMEEGFNLSQDLKMADLTAGYRQSDILYKIKKNELIQAVASLVEGTATPSLKNQSKGYITRPRSGVIYHRSKRGNFKLTLRYASGLFTIIASK